MRCAHCPRKPKNRRNRQGLGCTGVKCGKNNKVAREAMDPCSSAAPNGCR